MILSAFCLKGKNKLSIRLREIHIFEKKRPSGRLMPSGWPEYAAGGRATVILTSGIHRKLALPA